MLFEEVLHWKNMLSAMKLFQVDSNSNVPLYKSNLANHPLLIVSFQNQNQLWQLAVRKALAQYLLAPWSMDVPKPTEEIWKSMIYKRELLHEMFKHDPVYRFINSFNRYILTSCAVRRSFGSNSRSLFKSLTAIGSACGNFCWNGNGGFLRILFKWHFAFSLLI